MNTAQLPASPGLQAIAPRPRRIEARRSKVGDNFLESRQTGRNESGVNPELRQSKCQGEARVLQKPISSTHK